LYEIIKCLLSVCYECTASSANCKGFLLVKLEEGKTLTVPIKVIYIKYEILFVFVTYNLLITFVKSLYGQQ